MRIKRLAAAIVAAATFGAAGAGAAVADQIIVDGDGAVPVGGNSASVSACTTSPVTFNVIIAARRNGGDGTNKSFANGSTVTVGFDSSNAGISASMNGTTIGLPDDWQSLKNNAASSATVTATLTLPAQTSDGSGKATFSYTGQNSAGGAVTGTNDVTVNWTTRNCDSTPPALHLPADITAEATSASGALVTYSATATDTAPTNPTVTCAPPSGATFALGATTVACQATDAAGNKSTGSFNVTVRDTTPPAISGLPTGVALEAAGAETAVTWTSPTATDAVSGTVPVSCDPVSGSSFAVGVTTVTCSATDAAGNSASAEFSIAISDTTKPVLTLPSNLTAEATGPTGAAVTFSASAADLVDGTLTPDCTPTSGATFALGKTTVSCSATDAAGNEASGQFEVTVEDTTAPAVTVPSPITVEATGPAGATAEFAATATDLVNGDIDATCSPGSGSTFPLGTTSVTCSATDGHDNTGSATFNVTVQDTTAPDLTVPANLTVEATGPSGAAVTFAASAVDLVDGPVTPVCSVESGATLSLGSHQVDCTATDSRDNSVMKSFAVFVVDTTAPVVSRPGNVTAEATGPTGAAVSYGAATAADLVDGDLTATCTPASGSTFAIGATTVTCSATDAHQNTGSASFSVTVQDTTPPAISWVDGPADQGFYIFGSVPAAPTCTATDLVSGDVPCTVTGYSNAVGAHTVTATATDGKGNKATATRDYNVSAWTPGGFYQPVDMGSTVLNTVKGGSTVPLKFEVFAGSTELTSTSAVKSFVQTKVICTTAEVVDEIEVTSTGGTLLRYDSTGGQFIQNWQTPKSPGTCYRVTMTTQDGSTIQAYFKLK